MTFKIIQADRQLHVATVLSMSSPVGVGIVMETPEGVRRSAIMLSCDEAKALGDELIRASIYCDHRPDAP